MGLQLRIQDTRERGRGGGFVRDSHGWVLTAFSSFYGFQTNMKTEAMTLLEGLQLCLSLGLHNVIEKLIPKLCLPLLKGWKGVLGELMGTSYIYAVY